MIKVNDTTFNPVETKDGVEMVKTKEIGKEFGLNKFEIKSMKYKFFHNYTYGEEAVRERLMDGEQIVGKLNEIDTDLMQKFDECWFEFEESLWEETEDIFENQVGEGRIGYYSFLLLYIGMIQEQLRSQGGVTPRTTYQLP